MLKLAKLPDRTPVRIIINVTPELNRALAAYAGVYRQAYGSEESVADLIPFMLDAFLASDRGFAQARKDRAKEGAVAAPKPRRVRMLDPSPTPSAEG